MPFGNENNILYIPNARGKRLKGKNHNKFYAKKGMYLLLHPSNDGLPRWPIEWYANINGKPEMLMDNQHAFNCITNLNDIILQMIKLYTKYINDDRDKIKIIIEELTTSYIYEPNLMSFLDNKLKLVDYKEEGDVLFLNFNDYFFDSSNKVLEEVIYSIAYSVFDCYDVNMIMFEVGNNKIQSISRSDL